MEIHVGIVHSLEASIEIGEGVLDEFLGDRVRTGSQPGDLYQLAVARSIDVDEQSSRSLDGIRRWWVG